MNGGWGPQLTHHEVCVYPRRLGDIAHDLDPRRAGREAMPRRHPTPVAGNQRADLKANSGRLVLITGGDHLVEHSVGYRLGPSEPKGTAPEAPVGSLAMVVTTPPAIRCTDMPSSSRTAGETTSNTSAM